MDLIDCSLLETRHKEEQQRFFFVRFMRDLFYGSSLSEVEPTGTIKYIDRSQ